MFQQETKNRRMTPWELQEEKQEAAIWGRPQRYFIFDKPFYHGIIPEPLVNFNLGFKE